MVNLIQDDHKHGQDEIHHHEYIEQEENLCRKPLCRHPGLEVELPQHGGDKGDERHLHVSEVFKAAHEETEGQEREGREEDGEGQTKMEEIVRGSLQRACEDTNGSVQCE